MLMKKISLEKQTPCINQNIISLYITKPAIFFLQIFVDWLTTLIHRYRFTRSSISFLKVLLASKSLTSTKRHKNLLINESDPTFNKSKLILTFNIMKSFHNEIFFIFKVIDSITKEFMKFLSKVRLVLWLINSLYHIWLLIPELWSLLQIFDYITAVLLLNFRCLKGNIMHFLVKIFLWIKIKIIMFFTFIKELWLHSVLPLLDILPYLKLLGS